jgi:hypothetical protein
VAADGALQAGITRAAMAEAAASMVSWPGITQVRAAIEDAVLGAESVGETLARELVCELGHGVPETQFPVRIPSGIAWCDLRLGCHVFEFHGRIKLRSVERGGVAEQAAEQVAWDERRRERDVCAEGLGASRIYWDDLWGRRPGQGTRATGAGAHRHRAAVRQPAARSPGRVRRAGPRSAGTPRRLTLPHPPSPVTRGYSRSCAAVAAHLRT